MLAMFKDVELPKNNERTLGLLKRINTLWSENSWLSGEKHYTRHRRVSVDIQEKLIEIAENSPDILEELLDSEICLDPLIQWVQDQENNVGYWVYVILEYSPSLTWRVLFYKQLIFFWNILLYLLFSSYYI